jgi:hypothetical protein
MLKCLSFWIVLSSSLAIGQAGSVSQYNPNHETATQKQGQTTRQNENQRIEQAQGSDQTPGVLGVIGDSKCGRSHTVAPGLMGAGCTRYCINTFGANYILITKDKIYTLTGDKKLLDNYAGVSVRVVGNVGGNSIAVRSISPAYEPSAGAIQPRVQ